MANFGWSYPPGCNGPPDEDEPPCICCGLALDHCICPECPECGCAGDPDCYPAHGLAFTAEQAAGRAALAAAIESERQREAEWAAREAEEQAKGWDALEEYWRDSAREEKQIDAGTDPG